MKRQTETKGFCSKCGSWCYGEYYEQKHVGYYEQETPFDNDIEVVSECCSEIWCELSPGTEWVDVSNLVEAFQNAWDEQGNLLELAQKLFEALKKVVEND